MQMENLTKIDYDIAPDPRSNYWSAKDDALAFYMFAICPFLDIRKNVKLLPYKTPADIYARFKKIMKSSSLQTRMLQECSGSFCDEPLPFSESEIYSMSKIFIDNPKKIIETVASMPYLFNPIRTPQSITKEIRHMKKEYQSNNYQSNYYVKRYLSFLDKIRSYKISHKYDSTTSIETSSLSKKLKSRLYNFGSSPDNRTFDDIEAFINAQFRSTDLALLFGFMSFHKMLKTRIVIGRESPKVKADVNLAIYHMQTVCRQHCIISFCSDGKFYLTVLGREVFVNGELFYRSQNIQLKNHDIIDVGGVPLMFIENPIFRKQIDELFDKRIITSYQDMSEDNNLDD